LLRWRRPGARLGALALALAVSAGCATTWDASVPPRTVRLVVAVDDAFRFHAGWEDELHEAVRATSRIFEDKAGIRFETVRVVHWDPPPLGDARALDHLTTIPAADADIVVGVSGGCDHTHAGSARIFSRVALTTTGCTPFLRKRTPTLPLLLTHELAHLFGAFHPAPGVRSMMRGGPPELWDSQTLRVVRLMRLFDFRRGIDSVDAETRSAYTRIYEEGHDPGAANGVAIAVRNDGRVLIESGKADAARQRFLEALALDPQWYQPYSDLGVWHARRRELKEASEYFRQSAARMPATKVDDLVKTAARLSAIGDHEAAVGVSRATVRVAPSSAEARLQLIDALLRARRFGEAATEVDSASAAGVAIPARIREQLARELGAQPAPTR
jgi:hypothetical protein